MKEFVMFTHKRPSTGRICNHQAVEIIETEESTVLKCDACGMVDEVVKD